jgi:hypothetical protein
MEGKIKKKDIIQLRDSNGNAVVKLHIPFVTETRPNMIVWGARFFKFIPPPANYPDRMEYWEDNTVVIVPDGFEVE